MRQIWEMCHKESGWFLFSHRLKKYLTSNLFASSGKCISSLIEGLLRLTESIQTALILKPLLFQIIVKKAG